MRSLPPQQSVKYCLWNTLRDLPRVVTLAGAGRPVVAVELPYYPVAELVCICATPLDQSTHDVSSLFFRPIAVFAGNYGKESTEKKT